MSESVGTIKRLTRAPICRSERCFATAPALDSAESYKRRLDEFVVHDILGISYRRVDAELPVPPRPTILVDCADHCVTLVDRVARHDTPLIEVGGGGGAVQHPDKRVSMTINDHEMMPLEWCAIGERRALWTEVGDDGRLSVDLLLGERLADRRRQIGLIVSNERRERRGHPNVDRVQAAQIARDGAPAQARSSMQNDARVTADMRSIRCREGVKLNGVYSFRPSPPTPSEILGIATFLDPTLAPLGFAPGQACANGPSGQVIFCRALVDSVDGGCVDLVIDVESSAGWRITDVRYWGFPADRWHLDFHDQAELAAQVEHLARTLPIILGDSPPDER